MFVLSPTSRAAQKAKLVRSNVRVDSTKGEYGEKVREIMCRKLRQECNTWT